MNKEVIRKLNSMEEINAQPTNKDQSMDELKIDDNDEKEISLEEDLLGAQSLLMSASEDEEELNKSADNVLKVNTNSVNIHETAEEDLILNKALHKSVSNDQILTKTGETYEYKEEIAIEHEQVVKKRKPFTLVDSESDVEDDNRRTVQHKPSRKLLDSDEDNNATDKQTEASTQGYKKQFNLIDSDSDNDDTKNTNNSNRAKKQSTKKKFSTLLDTDTDEEDFNDEHKIKTKQKRTKMHSSNESHDTNSDNSNAEDQSKHNKQSNKKMSKLIDTDEESMKSTESDNDDNAQTSYNEPNESEQSDQHNSKTKDKQIRASAKRAMEDMQAIQSEQQRLHREAHIKIPYHKPKKHTLEEFLKRRTIIKPALGSKDTGSIVSLKLQSKSFKMNTEELEEYAKLMDERAKEATEFFKSESEEEEETEIKDIGAFDNNETNTQEVNADQQIEVQTEQTHPINNIDTDTEHMKIEGEQILPQVEGTNETFLKNTKNKSPNKLIITEVLQLPNLDLSNVDIRIDDTSTCATPSTSSSASAASITKTRNIKQLLSDQKNINESPTIRGDKDMLIDLDSGELISKKPTGIDNLLQRLIASKKTRKEKTSETLSIVSTENGRLEISEVNINVHDENDVNNEQKPGAAYFKLKNNLKSIIAKKRREDMHRKKAQEDEHNKLFDDNDEETDEEYNDEDEEYDQVNKPLKDKSKIKEIIIDDEENPIEMNMDEENDDDDDDEYNDDELDNDEVDNVEKNEIGKENQNRDQDEDQDQGEEERYSEANDEKDKDTDTDTDTDESSESDEDIAENPEEDSKRKNRIIKAFQDDSDDDDIDLLKTPEIGLSTALKEPGRGVLFESETKKNPIDEENELMGLCSGQFGDTQASMTTTTTTPIISQIPVTQMPEAGNETANAEELITLCSGKFDKTQALQLPTMQLTSKGNKILSSDEEPGNDSNAKNIAITERMKKLTKRMKKRKTKLGFSDDEDEDEDAENDEDQEPESGFDNDEAFEIINEDEPEAFVDYDSEENEIVVKMTKKDRVQRAQNFVENEAELSESEWGSADEDEKNMDKYDIELGDEDEFDREKLRDELGKIHTRKMLDEDAKEVRKLQEMFFEDEERDGVGRQRQFRWKNAENGFSLEDNQGNDDNNGGDHVDSGDEENEHLWRKIRFEREQLLKEQLQKENLSAATTGASLINSTITSGVNSNLSGNATLGTTKKLNIITPKSCVTANTKKSSPFLISKTVASLHKKTVRGSFLVRDKETLTKLAGLTKSKAISIGGITAEADETAGTVSTKSTSGKNFVFATLTEEEHECLKRKADDLMNSSNEYGTNYMKKPKKEPRREKCLIDQLL